MLISRAIGCFVNSQLFVRVFVQINTILTNNGAKCQVRGKNRMIYIYFYN